MQGTVESMNGTYGFIRGDNKISHFFIPTGLQYSNRVDFNDIRVGMRATFTSIQHPKGPRAIEVLIADEEV